MELYLMGSANYGNYYRESGDYLLTMGKSDPSCGYYWYEPAPKHR